MKLHLKDANPTPTAVSTEAAPLADLDHVIGLMREHGRSDRQSLSIDSSQCGDCDRSRHGQFHKHGGGPFPFRTSSTSRRSISSQVCRRATSRRSIFPPIVSAALTQPKQSRRVITRPLCESALASARGTCVRGTCVGCCARASSFDESYSHGR